MYWAMSTKLPWVTKSGVLDTQKYTNRMTAIARMLASRWRRNSWPALVARPLLAPGLPGGGPMIFALRSAVSLTSLSNLGVAAWDMRICRLPRLVIPSPAAAHQVYSWLPAAALFAELPLSV